VESIRRGVAPEAGIQGRCDGTGSEVDGGKPCNRFWRVLLWNRVYFGEVSRAEALDREDAKTPGRCCPAFLLSFAVSSRQLLRPGA
jgi:hypothetical protein